MSILMLLIAALIALFAGQNVQVVTVRFLGWSVDTSLVVVIVFSAAAGGLLVGIMSLWRQLQSGLRHRDVAGRLGRLQEERDDLVSERDALADQVESLQMALREATAARKEADAVASEEPDEEAEGETSSSGV